MTSKDTPASAAITLAIRERKILHQIIRDGRLSERYGELPSSISETPARLVAPASKAKPADKRDISRDDQVALETEIKRLHALYDAEMPPSEFEIRLGRGDYLPKLATAEAEMA